MPLTGGEAITTSRRRAIGAYLYRGWLLAVAFGYFGFCWVRGGQTLGSRAWRIRLQSADGSAAELGGCRPALHGRSHCSADGTLRPVVAAQSGLVAGRPAGRADAPAGARKSGVDPASTAAGRSLLDLAGAMRVVRIAR